MASHRYFDRDIGCMAVKLLPSEYYVTEDNTALTTVLGSCVAACLHDPQAGVAGMNHFMLPADADEQPRSHADAMRYGEYAMDVLLRELLRSGAKRERLHAKVFGGGAVLPTMTTLNIGDRNADFVVQYLREQGIAIAAQDLRGPHARRVCFLPSTGKAVVRKLRTQAGVQMIQRDEQALMHRLVGDAAPTPAARQPASRPA
ncbi:chemotaxis protein CheD [Variovorax sp. OV329]|nr:chemotaxis protein CheD [Variovorax sp. OV329]